MQALILLDLQNDYGLFGALPVPNSEAIIPTVNKLMGHFPIVVATQDWHPANHSCFAANHPWRHPDQVLTINGMEQKLSIIHCVQNSFGAELMGNLDTDKISMFFKKGTNIEIGSYSGFYDNGKKRSTGMGEWLESKGISSVFILGLATEGGINSTLADALDWGFKTHLIEDASCWKEDSLLEDKKKWMKQKGISILHSSDICL